MWNARDEDLIQLADEDLIELGLVTPGHVIDGTVIRQVKAHPVYDENSIEGMQAGCREKPVPCIAGISE